MIYIGVYIKSKSPVPSIYKITQTLSSLNLKKFEICCVPISKEPKQIFIYAHSFQLQMPPEIWNLVNGIACRNTKSFSNREVITEGSMVFLEDLAGINNENIVNVGAFSK